MAIKRQSDFGNVEKTRKLGTNHINRTKTEEIVRNRGKLMFIGNK